MTDEELIETLWKGEVTLSVVVSAAVRIQELVKERDDAEWVEVLRKTYQRAKEAEAKLAKAVEALRFYADVSNYDEGIVGTTHESPMWSESDFTQFEWDNGDKARAVLAELEKTE
jgi:hypothetical protein